MYSKIKEIGKKIIYHKVTYVAGAILGLIWGWKVVSILCIGIYIGSFLPNKDECKRECECKSEDK